MDRRHFLSATALVFAHPATGLAAADVPGLTARALPAAASRRQVALRVESTGLALISEHRVVEIGAVEVVEGICTGRTFHTYLNPERDIESGAQEVHGLDRTFLTGSPFFADVVPTLLAFLLDADLLVHPAEFHAGFLNSELVRAGLLPIGSYCRTVIDTFGLARRMYPGQRNSLEALCERFEIDCRGPGIGTLVEAEVLAASRFLPIPPCPAKMRTPKALTPRR
jgi:DNA polymerase III subunit epsilon